MNRASKQVEMQRHHHQQQQQKAVVTPSKAPSALMSATNTGLATPQQRPQKSRSFQQTPLSKSSGKQNVKRANSSPSVQIQPPTQQQLQFRTPNNKQAVQRTTPPQQRRTPQQQQQSRDSQTPSPRCYAGSKCYEPPTPNSLPKPPNAWMGATSGPMPLFNMPQTPPSAIAAPYNDPLSQHLMLLLKVQN
jgi:hypothetical protein